jgi:GTP cyclohydrolase FolE2
MMNRIVVAENCVFNKDVMPDIQNDSKTFHPQSIKKVGVRNIEVPLKVLQKEENKVIDVKATFSAYVDLTEENRGINMSRIPRAIMEQVIHTHESLKSLMEDLSKTLQDNNKSETSYIKCKFSYPYWTKAYASKLDTVEFVDIVWETIRNTEVIHLLTVTNVGMSLCPCSKEMSLIKNNMTPDEAGEVACLTPDLQKKILMAGWGAHNQRSRVAVTVQLMEDSLVWFEDLIDLTNNSFSAPIKNILKREDEKVEGEMAYLGGYWAENTETGKQEFYPVDGTGPKFVEDIARDNSKYLEKMLDTKISDFVVVCSNMESIHSRDLEATAVLTAGRSLQ